MIFKYEIKNMSEKYPRSNYQSSKLLFKKMSKPNMTHPVLLLFFLICIFIPLCSGALLILNGCHSKLATAGIFI